MPLLHVDCDMFFVQVAKLEDPEGVGRERLVMVGGKPEGRGVITSASYEVRAYGVRSGMPSGQAVRLCPEAVLVPVPRGACRRRSREVRAVLERFTPVVEAASIDEFYLDLGGTERLYGGAPPAAIAASVQRAVREETGIAVSVGGGEGRMIAKLATGLAKPNGIHVVPTGAEARFVQRFELGELPGVGPVLAATLRRRGLTRVTDALAYDLPSLRAWLGEARGEWLHQRVRGIDPTPVGGDTAARSVSHERTFPEDVLELAALERALLRLVMELGAEARARGLRARTVRVYVRDRDFRARQLNRTMEEPLDSDRALHRVALPLLRGLWERRSLGVRLLGVGLSNLAAEDAPAQMRLLDTAPPVETERDRRLSRAADELRRRFGADAIVPGRVVRE
jgi:DNA polymerase-4